MNFFILIGQLFLTFFVSFILYSFGIWSAGDAKYLLVLSLFIPSIGIIPFIGNLALLTLGYLFLYFLYFYFGKCLFHKKYRKSLYENIGNDIKEKWITHMRNKNGNIYKMQVFQKVLKFLTLFLLIFVSIRLSRIYVLNNILGTGGNKISMLENIIEQYHFYFVIALLFLFIGMIYTYKYLFSIGKNFIFTLIQKKYPHISFEKVSIIFIGILFFILSIFIIHELIYEYDKITSLLYKVFTLYLLIYIILKIFLYSYKITFQTGEEFYIHIKDLKQGEIVDIKYLQIVFKSINPKNPKTGKLYQENLHFFNGLSGPITHDEVSQLKNIFKKTNVIFSSDPLISKNFSTIDTIRLIKTFSFGIYIFIGCIITFLFSNKILVFLLQFIVDLIKSIY